MSVTVVSELPPEPKPAAAAETSLTFPISSMTFQDGSRFGLVWNEADEQWKGTLFTPGKEPLTAAASGVMKVMNALVGMMDEARTPATAEPTLDAP